MEKKVWNGIAVDVSFVKIMRKYTQVQMIFKTYLW